MQLMIEIVLMNEDDFNFCKNRFPSDFASSS